MSLTTETQPKRNAVIIEISPELEGQDRKLVIRKTVSIECKDESMLPLLEAEARRQLSNPEV